MYNNSTYRLLFVAVILVGFWLRVADLKNIPPGLHYDEGENLQRSWRLIHGYGFLPNFEGIPEPFDAYLRAGFLSVVGVLPFNARLYAVFLNLAAISVTIAAARALYWRHSQREAIALTAGITIAALPPFVMIGRGIYASNWIPLTTMLSLTALVWAWRTNKIKHFVMSGVFPALGVTFYLSGMAFVGAFSLLVLLLAVYRGFRWPKPRKLLITGVSAVITLIPWFSMFLWIPDWISSRIEALEGPNVSDPATLLSQIHAAIQPIFIPNTVRFPVYNPYTIAFLNPALLILFLIGLGVSLWRWHKPLSLAPVVILCVMLVPNILSNVPEQPIRMSGIYGALALVTGLGAGEVLTFRPPRHGIKTERRNGFLWVAPVALATVLIITPIITYAGVWYHYHVEPRLLDDPTDVRDWSFLYRQGYLDLMQRVAESTEPIYIPVEQLNSDLATVVLRPERYPTVRAYFGRELPAGIVFLPSNGITYGLPEYEYLPLQFALLLPDSHEILILPPLTLEAGQELQQRAQTEGSDLLTAQGWGIGRTLPIGDDNPFADPHPQPLSLRERGEYEPLAVFDNRLELLGIDATDELIPGELIPVTLYWRLREGRGQDYFVRFQLWDYGNTSRGTQNDKYALMFRYLYPPVMWTAGEIVTEMRWIQVFEDAPPGGYRFAISVNTYPGPTPVSIAPISEQQDEWALVGHAAVSPEMFVSTDDRPAVTLDAQLDDIINLTGVTLDTPLEELQSGDTLNVRLFWQAVAPINESYTLFLHVTDADGKLVAQQDTLPFDGQYPTWAWTPGETIVTSHALSIAGESSAPYMLSVGMYRYPSLERLVVTQNGVSSQDNVIVLNAVSR